MLTDVKKRVRKPKKKLSRTEKFEIYGDVLIEKTVMPNGRAGRIYLPMEWIGKKVKIVKIIR
jgi:putative transposon-encoded protein